MLQTPRAQSWKRRASLVPYWLRLHTANAGGVRSIPAWRTRISHGVQHGQKIGKKRKELERKHSHSYPNTCGFSNPVETTLRTAKSRMGATRHMW